MSIPESGSKRKLLDAAELLFAEKGFEAVSVRDITQKAKANVAAVNYHFGSRDELLALVMHRYMAPVTEERIARLDAAESEWSGKAVPLEEIIDALVRPLAAVVSKSDLSERVFHRLVGRIFTQQGDGLPPLIEDQLRLVVERFGKAFALTLPGVPPEELVWRMHFMVGGMIHMLTHREVLQRLSHGASGEPSMEVVLDRFIQFAASGMREAAGNKGATVDFETTDVAELVEPEEVVTAEEFQKIEVTEPVEVLVEEFQEPAAVVAMETAAPVGVVEKPASGNGPQITFDF